MYYSEIDIKYPIQNAVLKNLEITILYCNTAMVNLNFTIILLYNYINKTGKPLSQVR